MLGDAPTWTLNFLTQNWAAIQQAAPGPEWMPVELPYSMARARRLDELGCGHFGCVFATYTPGIVLKVSSDPSEADFIKMIGQGDAGPPGIVRYYGILDLPGSFRNRPIHLIWREEASHLGFILQEDCNSTRNPRACRDFRQYHHAYLEAAGVVRKMSKLPAFARQLAELRQGDLENWAWRNVTIEDAYARTTWGQTTAPPFLRYKGTQRLAAALRICQIAFELEANTDYASEVGAALEYYFERGVLLADVHFNNIGKVQRDMGYGLEEITVITDPGHAVFIK